MRVYLLALTALLICAQPVLAQTASKASPFEIVKMHSDIELAADGSYVERREVTYRLLTDAAVQALRQMTLSYTDGYQDLKVESAYTLKANGTRNDVAADSMLRGYGASTSPGFEDLKTVQVIFPNLEVGDEISFTTVFHQIKPWFDGQYAGDFVFSRALKTEDGRVSISAPASLSLQVDNIGLDGGQPENVNGQVRRVWTYHNSAAMAPESAAVSTYDTGPRLLVSTFDSSAQVAQLYRQMTRGAADVTPEIKAQADSIVAGISDRRLQARAIYEWVSTHVGYVNIVLGAGGFVPHRAPDILRVHYGDCKDHVVLLSALLAAEGIVSQPVLIDANDRFAQAKVASPFVFNHMINYLPEFGFYTDSTARFVSFGSLPIGDADRPVLNLNTGVAARTPVPSADDNTIRTVVTAAISRDGSAEGDTHVVMTGDPAMTYRAFFQMVNASNEADMFHKFLGPAGTGTLDKGNINSMDKAYNFSVHFHQENAANMPGPAAIYVAVGFRPAAFTPMVGGDLPPSRTVPYVCAPFDVREDLTMKFPDGIVFTSLPDSKTVKADGIVLSEDVERTDRNTIHAVTSLRSSHPALTCSPEYYARVRPQLVEMIKVLSQQIIYRLRDGEAK
ncbi:MAG: DUF3857 domain-containing transglutaminase family protein [Rhizomicrobium sp.]